MITCTNRPPLGTSAFLRRRHSAALQCIYHRRPKVCGRSLPKVRVVSDAEQENKDKAAPPNNLQETDVVQSGTQKKKRRADSSDFIASAVTRRFGLAGGLLWVGVLTFGVVSEQIKTRIEQADEAKSSRVISGGQEVTLPSGVKYTDLKLGGGTPVQKGYLVILNFRATADGEQFEDTYKRGKPIVFIYGGRPFTGGLCQGVEEALSDMRGGGQRRVTVPPALGFGKQGGTIRGTLHAPGKQGEIPSDATLQYELEVIRVSIPPS